MKLRDQFPKTLATIDSAIEEAILSTFEQEEMMATKKNPMDLAKGKTVKQIIVRIFSDESTAACDVQFTDETQLTVLLSVKVSGTVAFFKDKLDEHPVEVTVEP